MKPNFHRLFFVFLVVILSGNACLASHNVKTIAVGNSLDKRSELNLSLIAKSIEYIPLDNCGSIDGMLEDYRKLILHISKEGDLQIFQRSTGQDLLKVFSKEGKFKSSRISYGRGPGEYINGVHSVSTNDAMIMALDYFNVLIYREYAFRGSVHLWDYYPAGSHICSINLLENSKILIVYTYEDNGYISILDLRTNKIVDTVSLGRVNAGKSGSIVLNGEVRESSVAALYGINRINSSNYTCASRGCDTVFSVNCSSDSLKVEPLYSLDFGRYRKNSAMSDFYLGGVNLQEPREFFGNYSETGDYLFFCVLFAYSKYPNIPQPQLFVPIVYNKVNGKTYSLKFNKKFNVNGFLNDLDGGMPFWPQSCIGNCLYRFVEASDFIEMASKSTSSKMKEVAATITEESNPILVKVTLK